MKSFHGSEVSYTDWFVVLFFSYTMAEKCDGQLKGMVQDLKEIIDYLNSTNANQKQEDNPVYIQLCLSQFNSAHEQHISSCNVNDLCCLFPR
jgi:hypothetical protein